MIVQSEAQFGCDNLGCTNAAKWGCRVEVPPEGMPLDMTKGYVITLGLHFCEAHFQGLRFHSLMQRLAAVFLEMSYITGQPAPDFFRSRLYGIKIPDGRYTGEDRTVKNKSLEFGHYVPRG